MANPDHSIKQPGLAAEEKSPRLWVTPVTAEHSAVLARKYRPHDFDSVIGQTAVTTMLRQALRQNAVAQATVFNGVRGTGKTTLARILAKGLNCLASDVPTDKPCGQCSQCQDIARGQSLDVQEIDAASHTGVDHIRELVASVGYRPSSRFKVYILDEVHMLSTSAFNALLKTLEEPPAHVKFIFATTELRKIPATVLSRTQRFTLKRVERIEMQHFLTQVVTAEDKTAEDSALTLIARAGEGSVRDSLSILDQLLSGVSHVTETQTRMQLGLPEARVALDLLTALFRQQGAEMLALFQQQQAAGSEAMNILHDLQMLCHQLSRYRVLQQDDDVLSPDEQAFVRDFAQSINMSMLARLWQLLSRGHEELRWAEQPMVALEMLMIRALYLADVPTPGQILAQAPSPAASVPTSAPMTQIPVETAEAVKPASNLSDKDVMSSPKQDLMLAENNLSNSIEKTGANSVSGTDTQSEQADYPSTPSITDLPDMVDALDEQAEGELASILRTDARLKFFGHRKIGLYFPPEYTTQARRLENVLQEITGHMWHVELLENDQGCQDSLQKQKQQKQQKLMQAARDDSTMTELANLFPGAELVGLTPRKEPLLNNSTPDDQGSDDTTG